MRGASITDIPITTQSENLLGIENYATALAEFITDSSTPLTIGMQGEWGTGKTSLMYLVKEGLDKNKIATSWVNTWEHSLFKSAYETTPSVLKAMLEKLRESCGSKWTLEDEFDNKLKKVGSFFGNVANQIVKKQTGVDIKAASQLEPQNLSAEIAEIKKDIESLIQQLIDDEKNPFQKVVFFVDDLDRIEPSDAVEVLEALKNIFDLKNCIFILAIDYDVVIKGLEKKFGPKTENNEREFRSFFDKIIQVPFTMPIGAYDIERLLKKKFDELNLEVSQQWESDYTKMVQYTVGYIPRSIKRYINSYSLLRRIRKLNPLYNDDPKLDFCLFALLGFQISFPLVFRLLSRDKDFVNWDNSFAKQNGFEVLAMPDNDFELTDEEWEQVVWSFCQKDAYLKAKAIAVLEAFNLLRDRLGDDLVDSMDASMEFASMTSVDDDLETKQAKPFQRQQLDDFDGYLLNPKSRHSSPDFENIRNLACHIEKDIKQNFPNYRCVYSPSMGMSIYADDTGKSKIGGCFIKNKKMVGIDLIRDFEKEYRKPRIEGLVVDNRRKNHVYIDWYRVFIKSIEQYEEKKALIHSLFKDSEKMKMVMPDKILNSSKFDIKNPDSYGHYLASDYTYNLS